MGEACLYLNISLQIFGIKQTLLSQEKKTITKWFWFDTQISQSSLTLVFRKPTFQVEGKADKVKEVREWCWKASTK